jgi:hypothetical protein
MGDDDVARGERGSKLPGYLQKRVIVGDKNLHEIAHLRYFGGRTYEVRNRPWRAIPHENVESFFAKVRSHSASDNAEANNSDIFSRSAGHMTLRVPPEREFAREQTGGKIASKQC